MTEQKEMAYVPQQTAQASKAKKRQRRTLSQLQVYRDVSNMKFLVAKQMLTAPRKLAKFYDELLMTVSEVKKSIGLADASRDTETRIWYQDCALVLIQDVQDDFTILHNLDEVSTDRWKKTKALAKGIAAQLIAWRDYTRGEGAKSEGNQ